MNTNLFYSKLVSKEGDGHSGKTTQKLTIRDKIMYVLRREDDIPVFSATARRLMDLAKREDTQIETLGEVVRLDPGITAKFLKLASAPSYGGQNITSIHQALLMLGMEEVRKTAATMHLINSFSNLRVRVNWELFWLHSLLTARLTEGLATSYRDICGKEYLAGLLHDIGKLFMEHYFPNEFELAITTSLSTRRGMHATENELFDISHAEVSSLLCEKWRLDPEIVRSVRFHHMPTSPLNQDPADPQNQHFLAICICVADKIANICHANIQGGEDLSQVDFRSLPEWIQLQTFAARSGFKLDMTAELRKVQDIITAVKASAQMGGR